MVQRDVELSADGTTLRGWPFTPENSDGQRPPSSWPTATPPDTCWWWAAIDRRVMPWSAKA